MKKSFLTGALLSVFYAMLCFSVSCKSAETPELKADVRLNGDITTKYYAASRLFEITGNVMNYGDAEARLVRISAYLSGGKYSWSFADHPDLTPGTGSAFTLYFTDCDSYFANLTVQNSQIKITWD